jgi:hypothetical protein
MKIKLFGETDTKKIKNKSPAFGCAAIIPALGRLRQEDCDFQITQAIEQEFVTKTFTHTHTHTHTHTQPAFIKCLLCACLISGTLHLLTSKIYLQTKECKYNYYPSFREKYFFQVASSQDLYP